MPICQFFEHQIVDPNYTLSGLPGATTKNIEISNKYSVDTKLFLKSLTASYPNDIIIIGCLNINFLRNKFEILSALIVDSFHMFLLSQTKLNDTFTSAQFPTN